MADGSSTLVKQVSSGSSDREVLTVTEWYFVRAKLAANAGGVANQLILGAGSQGFLFDPGDSNDFLIAPGTRIEVRSDSSAAVDWSFAFTPMRPVNQLLNLAAVATQLLQILACSVAPGTSVEMVEPVTGRDARGLPAGTPVGPALVVVPGRP